MPAKKNIPSPRVRAQIAVAANVSAATVYRYFTHDKKATRPALVDAIKGAMRTLGVEVQP